MESEYKSYKSGYGYDPDTDFGSKNRSGYENDHGWPKPDNDVDTDSGVKEKKGLAGKLPPKWPERLFIVLCTLLCLAAAVTVTSHPDDPIEFRVSNYTLDEDWDGGRKTVYWRVKPDALPRWKRFANTWKKVRSCHSFYESYSGLTRYEEYSPGRYKNAEISAEHTVKQFIQVRDRCHTVSDIKDYTKEQRHKYRTGTREAIEKRQKRNEKEKIKNMWDEAVNGAAATDCD